MIFAKHELQGKEKDSTYKETITIQIDGKARRNDTIGVEPEHQQDEHEVKEVNTSDRRLSKPLWHTKYVMTSHVAYCLLTEGKLNNFFGGY